MVNFKRFLVALKQIDNGWVGAISYDTDRVQAIMENEVEFFAETKNEAVLKLSDEMKRLTLEKFKE